MSLVQHLTGECRKDFESMILAKRTDDLLGVPVSYLMKHGNLNALGIFRSLPPSMQFGVIQDFADSVSIHVDIEYLCKGIYDFTLVVTERPFLSYRDVRSKSRHEAREAAVIKFNEIYNSRK